MNGLPRGRFAPSPTGELHLGNARTALLAWLWTRAAHGRFVLRIEDLDTPRVRPALAEQQLRELCWLGLDWDEGPRRSGDTWLDQGPHAPYRQAQRGQLYARALEVLDAGGLVYPCFCSRKALRQSEASAPNAPADEGPRYPGTCRTLTRAQVSERLRTRTPALRLRVPDGRVSFEDALLGPQTFDPQAEVGDFVLRRADGVFAYQLAVVVDDAAMGITQVLRGADLLSSTARQLLLYKLLSAPPPCFAHAPLVFGRAGPDGRPARLSKRDRAVSLTALREDGHAPRALVARLGRSLGLLSPEVTACTPRELLPGFALDRVPRTPVTL